MKRSKLLCALLAGIATLLVLAACNSGQDYSRLLDKNSPVTITIWHYYNGIQQTQFDEMVNEFDNTVGSELGIVVEAYSKGSINELADSVVAAVNREPGAGALPDIFATYAETAYQIDQAGQLVDLAQYFSQEQLAAYIPEYLAEGAFSGEDTLKIFPTAKSTEVMLLNQTDWEKFAQAWGFTYADLATWEGLVEVAASYYEYTDALTPDIANDGKAFFGRDAVANYMIVGAKQLGHEFASTMPEGAVQVTADRETVKKLWDCYYVPYVKGYFHSESRFRSDDAKIGAIIALVCATSGAVYFPQEVTINDEYTYPIANVVLPVPNFAGCEPYIVQQGAGMSVIKSDAKTEYACAVFLQWFTESQRNIRFSVNSGYLPVTKAANDLAAIVNEAGADQISEIMLNTLRVAVEEVNTYSLYTSPPYDDSAELRDYMVQFMDTRARQAYAGAQQRIAAGEEREQVWADYTDEAAFAAWYDEFAAGLSRLMGE